jgi:hypothetical protein
MGDAAWESAIRAARWSNKDGGRSNQLADNGLREQKKGEFNGC